MKYTHFFQGMLILKQKKKLVFVNNINVVGIENYSVCTHALYCQNRDNLFRMSIIPLERLGLFRIKQFKAVQGVLNINNKDGDLVSFAS